MTEASAPQLGLVEDSPEDRAAFARIVAREAPGATVRTWPQAEALLEDLATHQAGERWPTALVVDLSLPGIDGAELVRRLRANSTTRALPVFVLSGSGRQQDVDRCYAAGANAYLTKPGGADELRALVRMLLASIAAFRTPTSVGGADGLATSDLAAQQNVVEAERERYEARLAEERRARRRAETLQRLASRLAETTDAAEVDRQLIDVLSEPSVRKVSIVDRTSGTADRKAMFMPDPFGSGTIALVPLTAGRRSLHGMLRVELPTAVDDDEEALLHSAASLASQALERLSRQRPAGLVGTEIAEDLPIARWWREAVGPLLRESRETRAPLSVATVKPELAAVAAERGHLAADAVLLAVVDAWREAGHDLLSPLGTEALVALLPRTGAKAATNLAEQIHERLQGVDPVRCAVVEWDGRDTPDALLGRVRQALAHPS